MQKVQLDEAIAAYREAVRLKQDSPDWRFILAALTGDSSMPTAPPRYLQGLFRQLRRGLRSTFARQARLSRARTASRGGSLAGAGKEVRCPGSGCGTGLCGVQFRPHAHGLVGVDLSPKMLQKAAEPKIDDRLVIVDILARRAGRMSRRLRSDPRRRCLHLCRRFGGGLCRRRPRLRPAGFFAFSIERHDEGGFVLQTRCRFAHSLAYVRELAQKHGLPELHAEGNRAAQGRRCRRSRLDRGSEQAINACSVRAEPASLRHRGTKARRQGGKELIISCSTVTFLLAHGGARRHVGEEA